MDIQLFPDRHALAFAAARHIAVQVERAPTSVLGMATGNTMTPLHEALVRLARSGEIDFSKVVTFAIDEYVGVPRQHPGSCYARLRAQFLQHVPVLQANIHFPDGQADSLTQACLVYEDEIRAHGGIDLQILGIGLNGHIGFNEPGTPFDSRTHAADLAAGTLAAKASLFAGLAGPPRRGITLGIGTLLQARAILLLAFGSDKAGILRRTLRGPASPEVPASALQLHPKVTVMLDRSADLAGFP